MPKPGCACASLPGILPPRPSCAESCKQTCGSTLRSRAPAGAPTRAVAEARTPASRHPRLRPRSVRTEPRSCSSADPSVHSETPGSRPRPHSAAARGTENTFLDAHAVLVTANRTHWSASRVVRPSESLPSRLRAWSPAPRALPAAPRRGSAAHARPGWSVSKCQRVF